MKTVIVHYLYHNFNQICNGKKSNITAQITSLKEDRRIIDAKAIDGAAIMNAEAKIASFCNIQIEFSFHTSKCICRMH